MICKENWLTVVHVFTDEDFCMKYEEEMSQSTFARKTSVTLMFLYGFWNKQELFYPRDAGPATPQHSLFICLFL